MKKTFLMLPGVMMRRRRNRRRSMLSKISKSSILEKELFWTTFIV